MLEKKINIKVKDKNKSTALYLIAAKEYKSIMRLLLKKGINIDIKNKNK